MRVISNQASGNKLSLVRGCFAVWAVACGDDDGSGTDAGGGFDAGPRDASAPMCSTTGEENTAAACSDECDNDGDDFADCDDRDCCGVRTDCPSTTFCGRPRDGGVVMMCDTAGDENTVEACSNGCDDDGNGFFDCGDFDCCGVRTDCPPTTACGMRDGGVPAATYTIEELTNRADPMHPAPGVRVNVEQDGLVALTPRLLVGSQNVSPGESCRFTIWVGAAESGEFTAIQVQELVTAPAGVTSCFNVPPGRISPDFAPGDAVTAISNATYNEFCGGPTPNPSPCTEFEQSTIFLGGSATITRGDAGTPPTGTVVPVSDLVGENGAPGARSVALESGLFTVEDVRIGVRTRMSGDRTFYDFYAFTPDAPDVHLDILVQFFPTTACVRDHLNEVAAGTDTATVTGVLVPSFGRWSLRLRDHNDIAGLTCGT